MLGEAKCNKCKQILECTGIKISILVIPIFDGSCQQCWCPVFVFTLQWHSVTRGPQSKTKPSNLQLVKHQNKSFKKWKRTHGNSQDPCLSAPVSLSKFFVFHLVSLSVVHSLPRLAVSHWLDYCLCCVCNYFSLYHLLSLSLFSLASVLSRLVYYMFTLVISFIFHLHPLSLSVPWPSLSFLVRCFSAPPVTSCRSHVLLFLFGCFATVLRP